MRKKSLSFRRGWRKIHVGLCAATQQVVALLLTDKDVADSLELPPLLKQVQGEVKTVICDGAYDCVGCYEAIHERRAWPLIPPPLAKGHDNLQANPPWSLETGQLLESEIKSEDGRKKLDITAVLS